MTDLEMSVRVAEKVKDAGGMVYYVGGFVRDIFLGLPVKDVDIEVHGITPETLCLILDTLGERTTMGVSFGVYGLRHYDLDIAMPRKERAVGRGHKDFEVNVDPFIGEKAAARRRDFTINALMQNVLTGEILDYYGGMDDLKKGILRHVSDDSFGEDPLRVLRAAQFAARFGFTVAQETKAICRRMDLQALASERIFGEMSKALLKAKQPSLFFEELRSVDQLDTWFPELEALIGVEQDPIYHPEGDVWIHTMQVLDRVAAMRSQAEYPLGLMVSALCHDFGKTICSFREGNRIHAYGHESKGLPIAERFLRRLTTEDRLIRYTLNMVANHMKPNTFAKQDTSRKKYMKLFDEAISPSDLLLLAAADRGEHCDPMTAQKLHTELDAFEELKKQPPLGGKDLLACGITPGKHMGEMLDYARKLWYAGITKEKALKMTLAEFGFGAEKS